MKRMAVLLEYPDHVAKDNGWSLISETPMLRALVGKTVEVTDEVKPSVTPSPGCTLVIGSVPGGKLGWPTKYMNEYLAYCCYVVSWNTPKMSKNAPKGLAKQPSRHPRTERLDDDVRVRHAHKSHKSDGILPERFLLRMERAFDAAELLTTQFLLRYPPARCPMVSVAGCINRSSGAPDTKLIVYTRTKKQLKELRALKNEINPAMGGLRITHSANPGFFTFNNFEVEILIGKEGKGRHEKLSGRRQVRRARPARVGAVPHPRG